MSEKNQIFCDFLKKIENFPSKSQHFLIFSKNRKISDFFFDHLFFKIFFRREKLFFFDGIFLKFISWLRRIDSDAFLVDWSMLHRLYIAIYKLRPQIYRSSRFQNNSLHIHIPCVYAYMNIVI